MIKSRFVLPAYKRAPFPDFQTLSQIELKPVIRSELELKLGLWLGIFNPKLKIILSRFCACSGSQKFNMC